MDQTEISDVYFRRLVIPIIITILIMCGIAVIIATPPGTPVKWDTFSSAFGGVSNQIAGAFRR
jgi:hypothetical protein